MQRLADESDLRDLIHRYALGLDTRDWALWRSTFTDEDASIGQPVEQCGLARVGVADDGDVLQTTREASRRRSI